MSDVADKIVVQCRCGATLRVKSETVGRKVRCPKCQGAFRVEDPATAESGGADDGTFGLMEELADQSEAAPPVTRSTPGIACPNCATKLPAESRLCVSCGYDLVTGKVRKAASARSADRAAKAKKLVGGVSRLALGSLFSGIGALIGAGVWIVVAMLANMEIGYIAWGLGLLAGFGMRLGRGEASTRGGIIAAVISLGGICIAKLVIFIVIIYGVATGDTSNVDIQRGFVAMRMAEEAIEDREFDSPAAYEAALEAEFEKSGRAMQELSDDTVRKRWKYYQDADAALERGATVLALADHHTERRANAAGLLTYGDGWWVMQGEEEARLNALSPEALEAERAALEAWENGEKWADEAFIRDQLIYVRVQDPIADWYVEQDAAEDEDRDLPDEVWKDIYTKAAADVDAMTHSARVAEVRRIEEERQRSVQEFEDTMRAAAGSGAGDDAGFVAGFIAVMFGPLDLLLIGFALFSAFKVAGGGED